QTFVRFGTVIEIGFTGVFAAASAVLLIWVTWKRQTIGPFTHYPMFRGLLDPDKNAVFRLQLLMRDGSRLWFQPRFPHLIRQFHHDCERELARGKDLHRVLKNAAASLEIEGVAELHVVCRRLHNGKIQETVMKRVSVTQVG
ncbi:MAG: hypothetical protein AAF585_27865, partial [Verrucomicrobiota bacterium]